MSQEVCVSLERRGSVIDFDFESVAFGKVHVETDALPEDERTGQAKKLLGSAVLHCYVSALAKALDTRGVPYEVIDGRATVVAGTDDQGRGRIVQIRLDVNVHADADYEDIFERVQKVMKNGCLISASIEPAIPVVYNLALVCPEDD